MRVCITPLALALILTVTVTAAAGPPLDPAKLERAVEMKRLEGGWLATFLVTADGVEPYPLKGRGLGFTDGAFVRLDGRRTVQSGQVRLDPAARQLDLVVEQDTPWDTETRPDGPKEPYTLPCAYRVVGDLLTVAHGTVGRPRPADLTAGNGRTVVVYERVKEPPAGPLPAATAEVFDAAVSLVGTWVLDSHQPADPPGVIAGKRAKRTVWIINSDTTGDTWHWWSDGQPLTDLTAEFPPGPAPRRVALTFGSVPTGPRSTDGQRWTGIYKRDGDRLTVCVDPTGRGFPDGFAARPDGSRVVYVFRLAVGPQPEAAGRGGLAPGATASRFHHPDLEPLQGRWRLVALETPNGRMPADQVKALDSVLAVERNTYTHFGKGKQDAVGRIAVDTSRTPHTMLRMRTDGPEDFYSWRLYELDGDTLRVCKGIYGRLPTAFQPAADTVMREYQRVK